MVFSRRFVSCVKPLTHFNRGLQIMLNVCKNCFNQMEFLIYFLCLCTLKEMESKCLFEARGDSICSESFQLLILSNIEECELIVNRCSLPSDLSKNQLQQLWICEKHKLAMGKEWRPRVTCQYPLHSGRKKKLITRNTVTPEMSRQIDIIYGKRVAIGSCKYHPRLEEWDLGKTFRPFRVWK